ncbi:MAG TPA: helix-turn-helix domain-containing protein [Acidimicrobiales bacterium]
MADQQVQRRRYHSPLREERARQTRAAVLAAAAELFTGRGWAATGMRDIAREAGTATETLYSYFPSKTALLQAVIDVAVVGDEAPLAVAERPEFALLGQGSRADRIAASARLVTEIQVRTVGLGKVLREAAHGDEAIAEMLDATRERQRRDVAAGVGLMLGREATAREIDGVWAVVSIELYVLLVEVRGWSTDEYESWLTDTLGAILPST